MHTYIHSHTCTYTLVHAHSFYLYTLLYTARVCKDDWSSWNFKTYKNKNITQLLDHLWQCLFESDFEYDESEYMCLLAYALDRSLALY